MNQAMCALLFSDRPSEQEILLHVLDLSLLKGAAGPDVCDRTREQLKRPLEDELISSDKWP